jgi:uncharacterized membrane protein
LDNFTDTLRLERRIGLSRPLWPDLTVYKIKKSNSRTGDLKTLFDSHGTLIALMASAIDRSILIRGLLIAALDPLWMSWAFTPGSILLQVLFAIGASFVCVVPLRRLRNGTLACFALGLMFFGEAIIGGLMKRFGGSLPLALLLSGGFFGKLIIGYPLPPWLAIMMLG